MTYKTILKEVSAMASDRTILITGVTGNQGEAMVPFAGVRRSGPT
jgi:FlaA1/EpsC-like NDP-sugar epimerase